LYEALLELAEADLLPLSLLPTVIHQFDQVVADQVRASRTRYHFTGKLRPGGYRQLGPRFMQWFSISGFVLYRQTEEKQNNRDKKRKQGNKKSSSKFGKRILRLSRVKLWAYDPLENDPTVIQVESEASSISPYVIEIEKKAVMKKVKVKFDKKKDAPAGEFNPLLHATELTGNKTQSAAHEFLRPMPYNEKLKRGGKENSLAIAESQLGKLDVLKGRYRKQATEYPYRCVEDAQKRRSRDLNVVRGKKLAERTYKTVMKDQDRFLAEMAANAGGCLALVAHNIHVEPEAGRQTTLQRDNYSTRRKNRIEHASFNIRKDFKVVKKPKKKFFNSNSSEEDIVEKKKKKSKGKMKSKRKSLDFEKKINKSKCENKGNKSKERNLQIEAGPAMNAQISESKELCSKLEVRTKKKESKDNEWKAKTVDLDLDFLDDLVKQSSSLGESNASKECSGKKAEKETALEVKVKQEPSKCREVLDLFNAGAGIFMPTEGIPDVDISFDTDAFDG